MAILFESIAQLDHSKEFAKLHQKFHKFNPLKVLRVDQFEIRHSNVLAWLLDPHENHQLGSTFLKKLLTRLLTRTENEEKYTDFDFLANMYASFSDVEVYREVKTDTNRYIDLVVAVPSQKMVILIENKFHAAESVGQLDDYLNHVKNIYQGYQVVPVFLTLRSDAPTHNEYMVLDYNDVLEIILLHIELNRDAISDNIYEFLMYYCEVLKEELVHDDEAAQLALDVYQANKPAIDLLYLSQHGDYRKQPRYEDHYQLLDTLSLKQQEGLRRVYEKKRKTIDFIFTIGSNVLREAFLSFVQLEEIPAEVYRAHVQFPSFILPEWLEYKETIGEPEHGYWLGHGLIIWYERTWDERLKITIEVGPVPYDQRLKILNALEQQGIHIRPAAKIEGKKYTRVFTQTIPVADWSSKQEIVDKMESLFHDKGTMDFFKKMGLALESLEEDNEVEMEQAIRQHSKSAGIFPKRPFIRFAADHGILETDFRIGNRNASFILNGFKELEKIYGTTREKWWWHDSTFVLWFDRLHDGRLKLTLELGPLQADKRLQLIERLEEMGLSFSAHSKQQSARYTRLYSNTARVEDWDDSEEVYWEMVRLYKHPEMHWVLNLIDQLVVKSVL